MTNFGLLIAYVLPGLTAIQGWPFVPRGFPGQPGPLGGTETSLVGFLDGTLEAIIAGLTVSAVRWLVLDSLHHRTGIRPPPWDFALLEKSVSGFEFLIHIHYRYYKFYGNMVIASSLGVTRPTAFTSDGAASRIGSWAASFFLPHEMLFTNITPVPANCFARGNVQPNWPNSIAVLVTSPA